MCQEGLWEDGQHQDHLWENEEEQNRVYVILAQGQCFDDPVKVANHCLQGILDKYVKERVFKLQEEINQLPTPSDAFPALQKKIIALRQLRKNQPRIQLTLSS